MLQFVLCLFFGNERTGMASFAGWGQFRFEKGRLRGVRGSALGTEGA